MSARIMLNCVCCVIGLIKPTECILSSCLKITAATAHTVLSLLGSCISFVMKSAEGADFKLIAATQRTSLHPATLREQREASRCHLPLITQINLFRLLLFLLWCEWLRVPRLRWAWISWTLCSACLCCSVLFSPFSFLGCFCLHTVNSWTRQQPNCCELSAHQPASVLKTRLCL